MQQLLFLATTDLSTDQRMIRICHTLANAGFSVSLLGRAQPDSQPLPPTAYKQLRLSCYFHTGKLFYLEFNLRLVLYLWHLPFDAVCAVDLDTMAAAFLIAKIRRKKLVYDAHEYFTEVPELSGRPLVKRVWEWLGSYTIPKTDLAYTVGPQLAGILQYRYGTAFAVIRNLPTRTLSVSKPVEKDKKIILYQGALNAGRGLEPLIEAVSHFPYLSLWLAGEGDLSDVLRQKVHTLQLEHQITFLGKIPPESLQALTPKAWIGVNLLEASSLSYYYSLANKSFDYVQAGIPSIQMDFPEYRSLNAQHACFLLIPDLDVPTLAATIRQLYTDDELYNHLRDNCQIAAREWVWEEEARRLVQVYQHLFANTPLI